MKKIIAILLCLVMLGGCASVAETAETESKPILGTLGGYVIKYVAPEGYQLSIMHNDNNAIIGIALPDTAEKPTITLSIAFNDSYFGDDGQGMRLNDISDEDMTLIRESFEDNTDVTSFEDSETAFGTKVLIVKGSNGGKEYIDVYSIYNAYEVEAVITGEAGTLNDDYTRMIIDFFSDIDFAAA